MDVSIIIVAWNVRQFLYNCLKSVYDQTKGIDFEVIYVDNASKDGSVEMVRGEFPQVKIIKNEENKGFIKANNQGIEISNGRYVLLLNSDTIVLDNAIQKTVKFADEHPDAAVVGCRVLNPDYTLQRTCFMYPSLLNMFLSATYLYKIFPKSRFFGREEMTWWNYNDVREVETICGCFSLVRNEAIKQIGLMDERYFVYGDDPDWCYRFKKNGWKIMFTPNGEIIHYGGQTTKQDVNTSSSPKKYRRSFLMARKFRLQLHGSELIFIKLHGSKPAFLFACLFTALFLLLRVPYWFAMAMLHKNERAKSMETAGTYLIGGLYCLTNWKKLLMNKEAIAGRF